MAKGAITTLDELIATATALERDAAERYRSLAAQMRTRGRSGVADVLQRLAEEEERHAASLRRRGGGAHSEPPPGGMERYGAPPLPDWADAEQAGLTDPYRALAFAVANEDRAFHFYSYVAAHAADDAVRALAEELAKEELAHAAHLRVERRKAYHAAREKPGAEWFPDVRLIESKADLLAAAVVIEDRIARRMATPSELLDESHDLVQRIRRASAEAGPANSRLAQALTAIAALDETNAAEDLERAFAFYDSVIARTADEEVMLEAQRLAQAAMHRLSLLS